MGSGAPGSSRSAPFSQPGNGPAQAQALIAAGVQHTPEAQDHLVKTWYVTFLGRQAQGGEELGWVKLLQQGQAEEQVLSQILASPEFYGRAQTLVAAGSADQRYVQALYQVLLNRTASNAEAAGWVTALPTLGRQGVALGLLSSTEFQRAQFEGYYNALLHRSDDPAGFTAWVTANLDMALARILFESSPEYFVAG
jgi:hypothetical protein